MYAKVIAGWVAFVLAGACLYAYVVEDGKAEEIPTPIVVEKTVGGRDVDTWRRVALQRDKTARKQAATIRRLRRANRESLQLGAHGLARAFLCIKQFEGSWSDPNPPYWGGMQMDLRFQRMYGAPFLSAWGTANNWPPFVQVVVAMEAYVSGRGFHPWPNTARKCGLL